MTLSVRLAGIAVFILLLLGTALRGAPVLAQEVEPRVLGTASLDEAIRAGLELEVESRWREALAYYEDLLRRYPDDPRLRGRAQLARTHLDVARRHADLSYQATVRSLQEKAAIDLCGEVLQKIESHYVERPDWRALVLTGLTGVEVALSDPTFLVLEAGCVQCEVPGFVREARAEIVRANPQGPREAADTIVRVGNLAAQRVRVAPSTCILEHVCAIVHGLDDYSALLTPDQLREVYSQIEGDFIGLGIELRAEDGALRVMRVISGSPADRGGLRVGDRIYLVDGRATADMDNDRAADMLQGPEGSLVQLGVVGDDGQRRTLRIRRARVEIPSVDRQGMLEAARGVAYMKLGSFQKTTAQDVERALWQLHRQGMAWLILDLRGNPGGLLTAAVDLADKFVQRGVIVSTRGRSRAEDFNYTANKGGTWRVPLIVLIDHDSASASEIFAGAIRDHGRGVIIGERSYGKGSVQGIFPLAGSGTGLRLTTAKFYSPSGRSISHNGVLPHVEVAKAPATHAVGYRGVPHDAASGPPDPDQDPVLARALQFARDSSSAASRKN